MSGKEAMQLATEYMKGRIPVEVTAEDGHSLTLAGQDGTLQVSVHSHGMDTEVTAVTDQLRTSRIDIETQHYLNQLPYQPEDHQRRVR
jgi:hypothetical protein